MYHERWVGEIGLVGKRWGVTIDDLNPNVPPVWNNFSPTEYWLRNRINATNTPQYLGYNGPYSDQGEQRPIMRTSAPVLLCPSDTTMYRSDQGCLTSYVGLTKYGWWWRGDTLDASMPWFEYHQMQEYENPSGRLLLLETEPGTWQWDKANCGCRWHAYSNPRYIVKRHYSGGNILFFDGHVDLVTDIAKRDIKVWEPDYTDTYPEGWIGGADGDWIE